MALLKSYSCVKCGGVLNFDENQEVFACPFCGGEFVFTDFHREDLLNQASRCLKKESFATASELYQTVLDKNPRDFEALRGKILATGRIPSMDSFLMIENLASADCKSAEKVALDAKTRLEEESRYFDLLAKMLSAAGEYHLNSGSFDERSETVRKQYRELEYVRTGFQENLDTAYKSFGGFAVVLGIVCTVLTLGQGKIWPSLIGGGILLLIFLAINVIAVICENNMLKKQAANIEKKQLSETVPIERMNKSRDAYQDAYEEFKKLSPDARVYAKPKAVNEKSEEGISVENLKKDLVCSQCGGVLSLNADKKLYECRSCGVAYGASLFFDEPLKKAVKALRTKEYQEADKRFSYMLMVDPSDFDALLGRILCAGKWLDVNDIALKNEGIEDQMANDIRERSKEAVLHSSVEHKSYFEDIQKLTEIYCEHEYLAPAIQKYTEKLQYFTRNRPLIEAKPGAKQVLYDEETDIMLKRREVLVQRNTLKFAFDELKVKVVRDNSSVRLKNKGE